MKRSTSLLLAGLCAASTLPAYAQSTDKAADSERGGFFLPDYSYAGYRFGEEQIPVDFGQAFMVADYGARADDEIDDTAAVKAAMDAAYKVNGPVRIVFGPGKYILTEVFALDRSQTVIQGAGPGENGTQLHFPLPLDTIENNGKFDRDRVEYDRKKAEDDSLPRLYQSPHSWTGGLFWIGKGGGGSNGRAELTQFLVGARESEVIGVRYPNRLREGDWVEITWNTEEKDAIITELYGDTDLEIGPAHFNSKNPVVTHRSKIASIDGNAVTLRSPMPHPASADVPAMISVWSPVEQVGIEDLAITFPDTPHLGHHRELGYNGIFMTNAVDSWVSNVTILNADAGILTHTSANSTYRDITTRGERLAHYSVHIGSSNGILAERVNAYNPVRHTFSFNTKSVRSVFKDSVGWTTPMFDQHAGANNQNLYDSITMHIEAERNRDDEAYYDLWRGTGSSRWQPGSGRYNTSWNTQVIVKSGAADDETVILQGRGEGPEARVIGVYGNRPFEVAYVPQPVAEYVNEKVTAIPSLYEFQLQQRLAKAAQ